MMDQQKQITTPVTVFYSYAHTDEPLRQELVKHLSSMRRKGTISEWHDREIVPGSDWASTIDSHLMTASIILLLISPDFLASDYCYGIEMQRALERHSRNEACVVPIILRPVDWQETLLSELQVLPTDAKPVTSSLWHHQDEAFLDVARGIRRVVREFQVGQLLNEARNHFKAGRHKQSFEVYDQVIGLDPSSPVAYRGKGDALYNLKRYEEALMVYKEALHVDPSMSATHSSMGDVLLKLERHEEALAAYEQTLRLGPVSASCYINKGYTLQCLHRFKEALAAYDQALDLDSSAAAVYSAKGYILLSLKQYEEALAAYEQALLLNSTTSTIYSGKGDVLFRLGRYEEALAVYEEALRLEPTSALTYTYKGRVLEQLAHQSYQQARLLGYNDKSLVKYIFSSNNVEPGPIKPEEFTLIRTLAHSHTLDHYERDSIKAIAISPNSQFIASGGTDATIKLWDAETGQLLHTFTEFNKYTPFVTFSLDGKTLIGSGETRTIKMWNVETGQLLRSFVGYAEEFRHATLSLDGQTLIGIVFNAKDRFIFEMRNIETGKCLHQWSISSSIYSTGPDAIAMSPDGKAIVSVEHDNHERYFRLWDVQTGTCLYTFETWSMGSALAVSPDGQIFASSNGKTIQFWSLNTGQLLRVFIGHSDDIGAVAFSPDGQMLISGSKDQTIKIWGKK